MLMKKGCSVFLLCLFVCQATLMFLPLAASAQLQVKFQDDFDTYAYSKDQPLNGQNEWSTTSVDSFTVIDDASEPGNTIVKSTAMWNAGITRKFTPVSNVGTEQVVDVSFRVMAASGTRGPGFHVLGTNGAQDKTIATIGLGPFAAGTSANGLEIGSKSPRHWHFAAGSVSLTFGNITAENLAKCYLFEANPSSTVWYYVRMQFDLNEGARNFNAYLATAPITDEMLANATPGSGFLGSIEGIPLRDGCDDVVGIHGVRISSSYQGSGQYCYFDDIIVGAGEGSEVVIPEPSPAASPSPAPSTAPSPSPSPTPSATPSPSPSHAPTPTPSYVPIVGSLAGLDVGAGLPQLTTDSRFYFGEYIQTGPSKTPILWRVLKGGMGRDGRSILLMSDQVLDYLPMHSRSWTGAAWSNMPLRNWLNGVGSFDTATYGAQSFAAQAFGLPEKEAICIPELTTDIGTAPGVPYTYDQLFALTKAELNSSAYGFGSATARIASATEYAVSKGAPATSSYWTRSFGTSSATGQYTVTVNAAGSVNANGTSNHSKAGVRPALYLDRDSILFASPIVADTAGNPALTAADEVYAVGAGGITHYKLTLVDYSIPIPAVSRVAGQQLTLSNVAAGDEVSYKLIGQNGALLGYQTATVQHDSTVTIDTAALYTAAGVTGALPSGQYQLYLWTQKSRPANSTLGSYPVLTTISVP